MITISEWVRLSKLNRLQQLLCIHDGWFTGSLSTAKENFVNQERFYTSYQFDSDEKYKAFLIDWQRETTSIVEKTRKKSWLRTLKNTWSRLF